MLQTRSISSTQKPRCKTIKAEHDINELNHVKKYINELPKQRQRSLHEWSIWKHKQRKLYRVIAIRNLFWIPRSQKT